MIFTSFFIFTLDKLGKIAYSSTHENNGSAEAFYGIKKQLSKSKKGITMYTLTFFYTEGVTYKATNVQSFSSDDEFFSYSQHVQNEFETVCGVNLRSVANDDILYVVAKETMTNEITIIPGLYDQFDIVPKGKAVVRQQNIEREAASVAKRREENAEVRNKKEKEKYKARRAARKAQYLNKTNVSDENTIAKDAVSAHQQLVNSGISENDITILRDLNIL